MNTQIKVLASLLMLVLSMSFIGCSDDDPQPAIEYQTEGFIKGKIVGVSADKSYTFNDDFSYSQYALFSESISYYQIKDDGSFEIELARHDFSSGGSAHISFGLTNAADVTPNDVDFDMSYYKDSSDKLITFYMGSSTGNTLVITDFNFDTTTGKVKGKYTLSGSENSTYKNATVTGEFDVTAKKAIQ